LEGKECFWEYADTVKTLCSLSGVSSFEDEVRSYLIKRAEPHASQLRVDAMGSLLIWKNGARRTGNKLMLCAHMDEVGLMVRKITDDGYLKFDTVGGIDRRVLLGKQVYVGFHRVPGVIGLKAYHLVSAEEEKKIPKLDEFYIDIGAADREHAESLVAVGDFAVFEGESLEFGEGMLKAKALDDRVGCAVMLKLLEEDLPMDCVFAFTVQEEVGTLRGVRRRLFGHARDRPGAGRHHGGGQPGHGRP
jgi:endoglucanase